ncbi:hypothetical protein PGTUg99_013105 [Puccinia graminis f. sp. tritici]|uniref:SprT-like domain-containing protein n=1 Tax=Puccinia graminis f. sp. tritici TaxID=56615 RepID=A0A5B0QLG6_PUCGR|nr:hypothetical protein PGTUg99_013105 [Puccinia graminis f. sp. tritici]
MEQSDRIAVAASRALQQISSSAHARSLPTTPRPPPPAAAAAASSEQQDEILDIFMSPDKPKSRLRQRAENSAKKFNPKKPILETDNNLTEHFVLNLGIPSKPTPDPKALADYKPPTRRSIGPRRSSVVSKRASSPTKSPKPPIELLLDDLDILDRSRASKSPFEPKKPVPQSTPKTRSNPTKKSTTSRSKITTKARRLTTQDIPSDQEDNHHQTIPKTPIPSMDCHGSDSCLADQAQPADHHSDCSSDSFDANILVVQPKTEELAQEDSIIINPVRPATRTRAGIKPKRVIADSEEEEGGEANEDSRSLGSTSFSSSKSPRSSTNKAPPPRRSQRKSSIRASHSQQKSSAVNEIIDVESDDSIEINPSRALQFQKLRSQALTTGSYSTSCDPLNGSISQKSRQSTDAIALQNNRRLVISSDESSSGEDDIQLKQEDNPSESSPNPIPGNRRPQVISSDDEEEEIQIKSNDNRTKPSPKPIPANRRPQVISSDESGDDQIQIKSNDTCPTSSPKPIPGNRRRQVMSSDESSSGEEEIQIKVKENRPKSSPKPVPATESDKPKAKAGEGGGTSKSRGTPTKKPTKSTAKTLPKKDLASLPFVEVREEMAEELLVELNRKVFGRKLPPIELFWSKRLNTTAGRAHYVHVTDALGNRVPRARVELASKVVDDIHKLRSTLAHELCHVACWFIDHKMRENHGRFFQAWGRKVTKAMSDIVVTTRHSYEISYKFKWACDRSGCNRVFGRHSDSIKPARQRCACGGRLVAILRNGKEVVAPATPPSVTTPSSPPDSSVELLIDLDSPDECTDHEVRPGRSSEPSSPPSTTTSTTVSTPNPYLSELEEIDPVQFLNPYLQALVLFDPVPFHPNTHLVHRPPPPPPAVAPSGHRTAASDLLVD